MVGLCFFATFVCYIDRVNISVAIIPMSEELGWDVATQGTVLSAFFIGYLLTQVVGGWLADRYGGKAVLATGVLLWSLFTILTPPAAQLGLGILLAARIAMGHGLEATLRASPINPVEDSSPNSWNCSKTWRRASPASGCSGTR